MPLDPHELNLVRRTLDGDHDAFGVLVLMYEHPLSMHIYSILRNEEYTHDVTQETFIAAYYALPYWKSPVLNAVKSAQENVDKKRSYVEGHPLAPWLYRIATNKALQFLKKQAHFEHLPVHIPEDTHPSNNTLEEDYLVRELLQEVFSSLSEEDALCIVLRLSFREPYSNIAAKINSSAEAVRKRIHRSIHVLRSNNAIRKDREMPL